MRSAYWVASASICTLATACDDFWWTPAAEQRSQANEQTCADAGVTPADIEITIESYPSSEVVIFDIDVIGTLSGKDANFVTSIRVGVVAPGETSATDVKPIVAAAAATWGAEVPIELLLGPTPGPGAVRIEAVTVDGCGLSKLAHSEPFNVGYPHLADAGIADAGL
jgi:hypothetical protein